MVENFSLTKRRFQKHLFFVQYFKQESCIFPYKGISMRIYNFLNFKQRLLMDLYPPSLT